MEQLIQDILSYVRTNYKAMNNAGIPAPPQALIKALISHFQKIIPDFDNRMVYEAVEEMDARGWITGNDGETIVFDEAAL